jgi:hypothetical protein
VLGNSSQHFHWSYTVWEDSVERLSPDIVELINLLKTSGLGTVSLDKIEVLRYFETVEPIQEGDEEEIFDGEISGKAFVLLTTRTDWFSLP